jgi:LacI family transcriptional regulator
LSFDEGYENAKELLQDHSNNVDAICTAADLLAIGALNYLNEKKIRIPEQLAVFGFSNWFMASVITPTLSSIEQNAYKMGEKSIETLLYEIDCKHKGIPIKHQKIIIDTELIIRNSC